MEGSKGISERDNPSVTPLALSRQVIVIVVAMAIVSWGCALFLWRQAGFDKSLLIAHNGLRTYGAVVGAAQLATEYGMALIALVYLLYLLFAFKHGKLGDACRVFPLVFLMFGLAGAGGDLLKEIIGRARPFVDYAGEINALSSAGSPSFPSGHATKSVALALPFLLLIPASDALHKGAKIVLAVIALGVCHSRVLLGAHYVSDVLAGIGLASMCFPLATLLSNRVLRKMTKERLNVPVKAWAVILFGLMICLVVL